MFRTLILVIIKFSRRGTSYLTEKKKKNQLLRREMSLIYTKAKGTNTRPSTNQKEPFKTPLKTRLEIPDEIRGRTLAHSHHSFWAS